MGGFRVIKKKNHAGAELTSSEYDGFANTRSIFFGQEIAHSFINPCHEMQMGYQLHQC